MPTPTICPCCKRPFPALPVGGSVRQRMVDYLAKHPEGQTVWELMDAIYADDPDGGPIEHNVVSVMAKAANKRLAGQGYRIRATSGPGSRWFLEQIK